MNETTTHERFIRNFRKNLGQYQPITEGRGWAKIGPETLYNLLNSTSGVARRGAKQLINQMARDLWTIKSTAKEGGYDPNAPLHITVKVPMNGNKPSYHLNCREIKGRGLFIYEITQKRLN
ncbi:MAG: hypothetical protein ABJK37_02170 [Paraglaciecola sp.]|uniref:hypothetical protein n=1 Tax=Paraglaciecola sp. TaxID=1920173 RepID=UPI00329A366F